MLADGSLMSSVMLISWLVSLGLMLVLLSLPRE